MTFLFCKNVMNRFHGQTWNSELLGCGHSEWLQKKLSLIPFKVRELCLFVCFLRFTTPITAVSETGSVGSKALGSDVLKNRVGS